MSLEQVKGYIYKFTNKFNMKELENIDLLKKLAKTIGIKVRSLILLISLALFVLVVLNYGAMIINQIVAFLYPAYMSFKAIESGKTDKHQQWLSYWIVIGFISVVLQPLL